MEIKQAGWIFFDVALQQKQRYADGCFEGDDDVCLC